MICSICFSMHDDKFHNCTFLDSCSMCFMVKETIFQEKCNDCQGLNWISDMADKYDYENEWYTSTVKKQRKPVQRPRRSNRLIEKQLYQHSINGESSKFKNLNKFYHDLNNSTLKSIV